MRFDFTSSLLPATGPAYRRDIQGLRAVAVLSVVFFHAWPGALPGGFVGVDVFFVISGFLISGILLRDLESGRFSLAGFYRRRVRRIFPALFVMLAATLAAGAVILPPDDYESLSRNTLSATFFASNFDFAATSGYFGRTAETRPLLHTWSLAVEEQFYLIYPLLLAPLVLRARRWLVPVALAAFLAALALSVLGVKVRPAWAFYLLPFRAFELLVGALAAFLPLHPRLADERLRSGLGAAGLAMIAASLAACSAATPFPGVVALLPTLGAGLLLHAGRAGGSFVARGLAWPPLLIFGAISYSLYLWHWPVLTYLRLLSPDAPAPVPMAAAVALSVVLAALSYRFVERPVLRLPAEGAPVLKLGLAGMAALALVSGTLWRAGGLPGRFSPEVLALFAAAGDHSPARDRCHQTVWRRIPYDKSCILGATNRVAPAPVRWAVWGDSHGTELAAVLSESMVLRQVTSSACPPVLGVDFPDRPRCRADNDAILAAMEADVALEGVVVLMNRVSYRTGGSYPEGADFRRGFEATVARLRAAGKQVLLVRQIPNIGIDAPRVAGLASAWGGDPARIGRDAGEMLRAAAGWNGFLEDLRTRHGLTLYDPAPALCRDGFCPAWLPDAGVLYFNATHVSMAGARRVAAGLAPLMADCRRQAPGPRPSLSLVPAEGGRTCPGRPAFWRVEG